MATFKIQGYRIAFADGEDLDVEGSDLRIITGPTDGHFRFSYGSQTPTDMRISLQDNNLTIGDRHLNDMGDGVMLELSLAAWTNGGTTRLLAVRESETGPDHVFAFGPDHLPDLTKEAGRAELSHGFQTSRLFTLDQEGEIKLSQIPGIAIEGVFVPQDDKPMTLGMVAEAFEFMAPATDDLPDDLAIEELIALANAPQSDQASGAAAEFEFEIDPEPADSAGDDPFGTS